MSDLLSQIAAVLSFPFCIVKTHAHSCWASQSVCYLYCHTSFTTISPLLLGGREAPAGPDRGAPSVAEHQEVVECIHPYSQYSGATNNTGCGEVISLNTLSHKTQKWGSPKMLQSGHNWKSRGEVKAWRKQERQRTEKGRNTQMLTEQRNLSFATLCWGGSFWKQTRMMSMSSSTFKKTTERTRNTKRLENKIKRQHEIQ